ncbi:hypothetical protein [Brucella pituitosa]|uniref:hypothetical protein n=1 Tax=Brucella pituitosa TaxID=571256 RepID=UPI0009A243FC|nr:hypothetical protein [Brucella pituitosa]
MNPAWTKWLISFVFGFLIARFGFGLMAPLVMMLSPERTVNPDGLDSVIIIQLVVQFVVVVISTILLSRLASRKLQIGWGCLVLGAVILLGLLATLFIPGSDFGSLEDNGEATAFFFWLLILVLPMSIGGGLLAVIGWIMIQRGRKELQRG